MTTARDNTLASRDSTVHGGFNTKLQSAIEALNTGDVVEAFKVADDGIVHLHATLCAYYRGSFDRVFYPRVNEMRTAGLDDNLDGHIKRVLADAERYSKKTNREIDIEKASDFYEKVRLTLGEVWAEQVRINAKRAKREAEKSKRLEHERREREAAEAQKRAQEERERLAIQAQEAANSLKNKFADLLAS